MQARGEGSSGPAEACGSKAAPGMAGVWDIWTAARRKGAEPLRVEPIVGSAWTIATPTKLGTKPKVVREKIKETNANSANAKRRQLTNVTILN